LKVALTESVPAVVSVLVVQVALPPMTETALQEEVALSVSEKLTVPPAGFGLIVAVIVAVSPTAGEPVERLSVVEAFVTVRPPVPDEVWKLLVFGRVKPEYAAVIVSGPGAPSAELSQLASPLESIATLLQEK